MSKFLSLIIAFLGCFILSPSRLEAISDFGAEPQCSYVGGDCVHISQCDIQNTVLKEDFCPFQSSLGAVCCGRDLQLFTDCARRGGDCTAAESCPEENHETQASCSSDRVCCIRLPGGIR